MTTCQHTEVHPDTVSQAAARATDERDPESLSETVTVFLSIGSGYDA